MSLSDTAVVVIRIRDHSSPQTSNTTDGETGEETGGAGARSAGGGADEGSEGVEDGSGKGSGYTGSASSASSSEPFDSGHIMISVIAWFVAILGITTICMLVWAYFLRSNP